MRFLRLFAVALGCVSVLSTETRSADDRLAAYKTVPDPAERRASVGRVVTNQAPERTPCPTPPSAVTDLSLDPFYERNDPSQSHIDPQALQAYRSRAQTLVDYLDRANRLSETYITTAPRSERSARCLADWLDGWASNGALLRDVTTPQGNATRKWALVGLALDYALLADAPEIGHDQRSRIQQWLNQIAWAWTKDPDYGSSVPNNHVNWAAAALLASAAASQDRTLFERGTSLARRAIAQIGEDGSLPLELERGSKAIDYHIWSLEPLLIAAEIAAANGIDLYAVGGGAVHRLARFTRDAMLDPELVARRTGVRQEWSGKGLVQPNPSAWGWAHIYLARHRDEQMQAVLQALRGAEFRHYWLGDLALRFGSGRAPR